ncbi:hypothetical protein THIX_40095 [Thiomonas sp. X19]|nr:hypothetical protein THIX_40095 [Thiomonas sp. X19]
MRGGHAFVFEKSQAIRLQFKRNRGLLTCDKRAAMTESACAHHCAENIRAALRVIFQNIDRRL